MEGRQGLVWVDSPQATPSQAYRIATPAQRCVGSVQLQAVGWERMLGLGYGVGAKGVCVGVSNGGMG